MIGMRAIHSPGDWGYGWGKMVFGAVVEGGYWALGMQRLFTLYYSTLVRLDVGKYSELESF
jgi:hypothetical protein